MIAANICAARVLRESSVLASITCIWALIRRMPTPGSVAENARSACRCRRSAHADGFCKLRRELDAQPTGFLDSAFVASSHLLKLALNPVLTLARSGSIRHLDFADP